MPATAAAAASTGATPSAARPVLATLEIINEGVNKGKRFDVSVPLAHVGRGAHNDVAIDDDSVSDTHAKLQRREDGWYLVDLGSTNGTYVGGSRVTHERRLDGMPDVRFGGVKLVFRAVEASAPGTVGKGTRAIAGMPLERPKVSREPKTAVAGRPAPREAARTGGTSMWTWLLILVAAAAAAFYLLK
jgi:pSer/pThr/pTyr-binding forkhead associated (FHA) protein